MRIGAKVREAYRRAAIDFFGDSRMRPEHHWEDPDVQGTYVARAKREIAQARQRCPWLFESEHLATAVHAFAGWQGRCSCGINGPGGGTEQEASLWCLVHELIGGDSRDACRLLDERGLLS